MGYKGKKWNSRVASVMAKNDQESAYEKLHQEATEEYQRRVVLERYVREVEGFLMERGITPEDLAEYVQRNRQRTVH